MPSPQRYLERMRLLLKISEAKAEETLRRAGSADAAQRAFLATYLSEAEGEAHWEHLALGIGARPLPYDEFRRLLSRCGPSPFHGTSPYDAALFMAEAYVESQEQLGAAAIGASLVALATGPSFADVTDSSWATSVGVAITRLTGRVRPGRDFDPAYAEAFGHAFAELAVEHEALEPELSRVRETLRVFGWPTAPVEARVAYLHWILEQYQRGAYLEEANRTIPGILLDAATGPAVWRAVWADASPDACQIMLSAVSHAMPPWVLQQPWLNMAVAAIGSAQCGAPALQHWLWEVSGLADPRLWLAAYVKTLDAQARMSSADRLDDEKQELARLNWWWAGVRGTFPAEGLLPALTSALLPIRTWAGEAVASATRAVGPEKGSAAVAAPPVPLAGRLPGLRSRS